MIWERIVSILSFFILVLLGSTAFAGRLPLPEAITQVLDEILEETVVLQTGLLRQDRQVVDGAIEGLVRFLDIAQNQTAQTMSPHDRAPLRIILAAAQSYLDAYYLVPEGQRRKQYLGQFSREIANLMSSYRIGREFEIVYCQRDNTSKVTRRNGVRPSYNLRIGLACLD